MDAGGEDLSWATVADLAGQLATGLASVAGPAGFDRVVGVARGGLVPAVLVAAHLGVKRLESIQVRLYEGRLRLAEPVLVGGGVVAPGPSGDPARTLIVDEMVDSGSTLAFLQARYPAATFAALVARRARALGPPRHGLLGCRAGQGSSPVWVVRNLETDAWILFPWSPPEDVEAGASSS